MARGSRLRAFEELDTMPAALRACVHEFGLPIVEACRQMGVREPRHIRQLVHEIWAGARQISQRGGALGSLDWLLIQGGVTVPAATMRRHLASSGLVITPTEPTRVMLDASLAAVSGFNVRVTKEEKHRRRLAAAIKAEMAEQLKLLTR